LSRSSIGRISTAALFALALDCGDEDGFTGLTVIDLKMDVAGKINGKQYRRCPAKGVKRKP
jgi:hypothetical protein